MKKIVLALMVMVGFYGIANAGPSSAWTSVQTFNGMGEQRVDSVTYSSWTIIGIADAGTADSAIAWSIYRVDSSGNKYWGNKTGYGAMQFDLIWNNRNTYNYGGK